MSIDIVYVVSFNGGLDCHNTVFIREGAIARLAVARRSPPNAPRCAINCVIPNGRSSAQRAPPRGYASSSEHTLKGLASAHAPSTGARRSAAAGASTAAASAAAWIIQVKILYG